MKAAPTAGTAFPVVVTHLFDPALPRFRNLCDAAPAEAEAVLDRFRAAGRRLGERYLKRRHATEAWLRQACRAKLGPVPLERPLYLFLGDFDDGLDPSRPAALVLPLALFPPEAITFTYGDSMERGNGSACSPQGRIFDLEEI